MALVAIGIIGLVSPALADRRFFRRVQSSSVPAPSLTPARPSVPPAEPIRPQLAPSEPTPTLSTEPTLAAPLTDAPRFVPPGLPSVPGVPGVPALKTPTLPDEPFPRQAPEGPQSIPPRTITSLRPDGAACLFIDVTGAYLNSLISTPRQDAGPVNDMVLGARVEGEQTTQSSVIIRTVPSAQSASLDVNLGGESCTRTTAMTPQASIDMTGRQRFSLHKSVEFDGAHFLTRTPATQLESCQQNLRARTMASQIPVVNSIAETIALNQANLRQPLARQETARQVTNRVVPPFNQAIDERLAAANDWLANLSTTLPNVHAFLTSGRWSSTGSAVTGQVASTVPVSSAPPEPRGGATVRIHESLAPSLSTALQLNGREITIEEIRRWIDLFGDDIGGVSGPDSLMPPLTSPTNVSLRLADDEPLALSYQNDEFRVVLRASIRAGDAVDLPVHRVSIGYSIRRVADSFELQPLPVDVQAEASGTFVSGTVEQLIKAQIEGRLRPVTISTDAIPPMANGHRPRVSDVTSTNGWLTVVFE
ncbi:hypothetical protein Pan44_41680 [Caulifigura coniformis]|uniref:Uncharacterized protein n=1 Tax=Caulifigura coniformis TaxID=2527983 RepID=A0A517SJ17_9PLAN|nr:hypothetical protein [Caulifigura coniformis]QDT56117.1 hypothetical protein Pan44_41680 [Caulifigura coniformis]